MAKPPGETGAYASGPLGPALAPGTVMSGQGASLATARRLWLRYELIHDLAYFSPQVLSRAAELGMPGFWMGYFAMRSAPLGLVDPAVVTATFFGFHQSRVAHALPDAWRYCTPEQALAARLAGVEDAIAEIAGDQRAVVEAADLLWLAAQSVETAGRPLAAANKALPRPTTPAARLWQATATLREHRGDGHIATLVSLGVAPAEAHQLKIAAGESDTDVLRVGRGFPDDAWQQGADALVARGWLRENRSLTEPGRQAHADIEAATDRLAAQPWEGLGPDATRQVLALIHPIARTVAQSGLVPWPNPVGLVWEPA